MKGHVFIANSPSREMAGLHRNYIGIIERAEQSATLPVSKIAHALSVTPCQLLNP